MRRHQIEICRAFPIQQLISKILRGEFEQRMVLGFRYDGK